MPFKSPQNINRFLVLALLAALLVSGCRAQSNPPSAARAQSEPLNQIQNEQVEPTPTLPELTPFPERPAYEPGELVDYVAQSGDTLPALAVRFNTRVEEILEANPFIPQSATTMPPGMPMKIPIYYLPFWGSPYQILPDSLFVNGPAGRDFDLYEYVAQQPGWLKSYHGYAGGRDRSGAEIVDYIATKFSLSPRLLLALLEFESGALSEPQPPPQSQLYPMGYHDREHKGLNLQLVWTANTLNNGYYRWKIGALTSMEHEDTGKLERFDPWQNAATVSLQYLFNLLYDHDQYLRVIGADGLALTYAQLFGDPWSGAEAHIPGSLQQPELRLPFEPGNTWAFTGGPHTGWGTGDPLVALDFAPPAVAGGCQPTSQWATAVAPGVVVRTDVGEVVLDLDGDGDERTGWVMFYLHVSEEGRPPLGAELAPGDPVGHPSCEGGTSTGTHVHIARKYNGEWIPAEGPLAFNLEGWIAHNGGQPYQGTLTRMSQTVTACECSNQASFIQSEER